MPDQTEVVDNGGCVWSLATRWRPPERLVAISDNIGVLAVAEAGDEELGFDLHMRVLADAPVSVMLEPISKAQSLPGRFALVDPVAGCWFQRVAAGTYRILVFGPDLARAGFRSADEEAANVNVVPLRPPVPISTVLPAAAAAEDTPLQQWQRLYEDADGNVKVEVLGGGQGTGKLTITATSREQSDALSMVRISLREGATPYLIPLAWSGEDCRGEIVVDDPRAITPTVEVGLWCFDLRPADSDCIVRSIGATQKGRTRRTWSEVAHHAARNGLGALEAKIRTVLDQHGSAFRGR